MAGQRTNGGGELRRNIDGWGTANGWWPGRSRLQNSTLSEKTLAAVPEISYTRLHEMGCRHLSVVPRRDLPRDRVCPLRFDDCQRSVASACGVSSVLGWNSRLAGKSDGAIGLVFGGTTKDHRASFEFADDFSCNWNLCAGCNKKNEMSVSYMGTSATSTIP